MAPIVAARSALLIAAAEARAPAIDTLWPDPRDPAELQAEIAVAACGGFAGKLCIQPDQLEAVALAFTVARARSMGDGRC